MDEPPEEAANQSRVPKSETAAKLTVPASQRVPGVVEVTVGTGFIVIKTEAEVSPSNPEVTTRR